jgi:hypothetical protein
MCHRLKFQNCKILQIGRLKAHPKAEIPRRGITGKPRKAGKIALFGNLRTESPPSESFRGLLSAAAATHFAPVGEREKISSITQAKFEIT